MPRDEFTRLTADLLAKRVAYRCSNPDCKRPTIGPNSDRSRITLIGVAAHITAAAPGGPRYDASLSPAQRAAEANGIWLCQTCGTLVDRDPTLFTVALLQKWKIGAEDRALFDITHLAAEDRAKATHILQQSTDFQTLTARLREKQEILRYLRDDAIEYRRQLLAEIEQYHKRLALLQKEVVIMYQLFLNISVDAQRLERARSCFEAGQLDAAREILDTPELAKEVAELEAQKTALTDNLSTIDRQLKHAAREYLLRASLAVLAFDKSDHLIEAAGLYEKAIATYEDYSSLTAAADFYTSYHLEKAIDCFKRALQHIDGIPTRVFFLHYNIGTAYFKLGNKQEAATHLEQAVNEVDFERYDSPLLLTLLGGAYHNLSAAVEGTEHELPYLEKAVALRWKAAGLDPTRNCFLAYTLNRLSSYWYRQPFGLETAFVTHALSVQAMEAFIASDPKESILAFEAGCLRGVIANAFLLSYRDSAKMEALRVRIRALLEPFEAFVRQHQQREDQAIADAYYWFRKVYILLLKSATAEGPSLSEKALFYFEQTLNYRSPDDDIKTGIASNAAAVGMHLITEERHCEARKLLERSSYYYNQLDHLDSLEQKYKAMVEEGLRILPPC